ncbi:MAG: sugar ABC transporter permease [Candidatus Dormiibacterota bacterium]
MATITIALPVRTRRTARRLAPYGFVAPAFVVHALIVGIPSVITLILSFYAWSGLDQPSFAGLSNYQQLIGDGIFRQALAHVLEWTAFFLVVPPLMGLGSALLLRKVGRGQGLYRTLYYLPVTMASVVVGRLFQWIYDPFSGVIGMLHNAGLGWLASVGLANPKLALWMVAFANNWAWWGFMTVLFLTGLGQIDSSLLESATIDGASAVKRFWYVIFPLLRPTVVFVVLLTTLWSFNTFDYPFLMTGGGPGHATEMLSTWMWFNLVNMSNPAYASTIAAGTTIVLLVVIAGYVYVRYRGWEV